MDSSDILSHLDQLDDEIDDLEASLAPMLKSALSDTTSKLPLLDRTKAYILLTYAIESVLFSYLRLNGVKAREHPVFKELTRVKQYFDKIKATEYPGAKRDTPSVDKKAASRFIKAGLSGNDRYDLERAERQAKEKAGAHIKFDEIPKKRKAEEDVATAQGTSDLESESSADELNQIAASVGTNSKKRKPDRSNATSASSTPTSEAVVKDRKKRQKQKQKEKKKATKSKNIDKSG